jgi:2'-5' RNA ligase
VRLFVALDIPDDVRAAIGALVSRLHNICRSGRWVRIEGTHVTLKFIGEVPAEKLEEIKTALVGVSFPDPIQMSFQGLGFFPNERHPRVLWAGVEASTELGALASAVETALIPFGIAREQRTFSPHLTVARFNSTSVLENLRAKIETAGPLKFGDTGATEFHLYQSVLKHGGAEYTRLADYSCTKGGSR